MKSFNEFCAEVGYAPGARCPNEKQVVWYAYKKGKVKQFSSYEEAVNFSSNIEKGKAKKNNFEKWKNEQIALKQKAINVWRKALRDEYKNEITDELFDVCYNRAIDHGRYYGYDSVAEHIVEEIKTAKQIMAIMRNKE
jgi:hypothetical protein